MKKIINIFSAVIALVSMSIACTQEVAPLASEVSVDKTEVTCEAVQGTTTVKVTCDGEWFATADADWLSITPSAGNGSMEVKIVAADNVDEQWKEVQGPRAGVVSFVVASKIATVAVNQNGEKGLDSKTLYSPITKAEDFQTDASYMIVAKDGDVYQAAAHVAGNYGYPGFLAVEMGELGITQPNALTGFTFESAPNAGEFYIKQNSDNRYWYQSGTYTNFNLSADLSKADAPIFSVTFNEDGTAVIKNVGKDQTLQANPARTSYGCYKTFQEGCVYPTLYKSAKAPTDEVLSAEEAKAGVIETTAVINVKSNKTWKVRNHDEWIKTFTKSGTGDGTIEVTFDKNPDIATERTASFQIIGETMNITVTLTQGTEELSAEDISVGCNDTEGQIEVKATHAWTVDFNAEDKDRWIKTFTTSGEGDGVIALTFDANPDPAKERKDTLDIKGQTMTISVIVTQKNGGLPYIETFATGIGEWTINDVQIAEGKTYVWAHNSSGFMKASAGVKKDSESWLISPEINLSSATSAHLSFDHVQRYTGNLYAEFTLWVSVDGGTTWTQLAVPYWSTGKDWNFVNSGNISLNAYAGKKVKIAFKYISNTSAYGTWEIKNVKVEEGDGTMTSVAEMTSLAYDKNVKTNFSGTLTNALVTYVNGNNVFIEDATGGMLLYKSGHGLEAGDQISGSVTGTMNYYGGFAEAIALDVTSATVTKGQTVTPKELTIDVLKAAFIRYISCNVVLKGITINPALGSNRSTTVTQGTSTIPGYAKVKNVVTIDADKKGDLRCYPCLNGGPTTAQVGVWEASHFTAEPE